MSNVFVFVQRSVLGRGLYFLKVVESALNFCRAAYFSATKRG